MTHSKPHAPKPHAPKPHAPVFPKKRGYHHGYLQWAAIRRGLQVVAERGPDAVTMRGIARDLGVSAAALVHFYGNRAGLRAAVAEAVAEMMLPMCQFNAGGNNARRVITEAATQWVNFAADNPNLYHFAFGEAWRYPLTKVSSRHRCVNSVRKCVGNAQQSRDMAGGDPISAARIVFAGVHGLALGRADGSLPPGLVAPSISRWADALVAGFPAASTAR